MSFVDEERMKELMREANCTLFISEVTKRRFEGWYRPGKYKVLPDGVKAEHYYLDNRHLFDKEVTTILLAGRISKGKGQLDAIKAIKILLDRNVQVRLMLIGNIGDEQYAEDCHKYAANNRLEHSVIFGEFQGDMKKVYSESDIALCCSEQEALGRVMIEGMLAGCLVITSDCESAKEIVDETITGYIYEQGNSERLADVIEHAITNAAASRELAVRGQQYALHAFDAAGYAKTMIGIYEELLGSNHE